MQRALAAAAFVVQATASVSALAHAVLVASQPAVNASVPAGDLSIRLQFASRIDAKRSRMTVIGPGGGEVAVAALPGDAPGVLAGRTRVARAGRWTLRWQVLSVDGHLTRGEVAFIVHA